MKPYFFNTILGILGFIIVILPFTGKVHDGRRTWLRGFTTRGWIICIAFLATLIVTYLKDLQADKVDKIKAYQIKIDKIKADSISRKRNDESNAKIVNAFTSALAKYGYKYDSAENVIKKIVRDSSKKQIIYGNSPELSMKSIQLKHNNDSLFFDLTLTSIQAASYQINLQMYTIYDQNDDNKYELIPIMNYDIIDGVLIPKDRDFTFTARITGVNSISMKGTFYFAIKGNYKDVNKKTYLFNNIFLYEMNSKRFGGTLNRKSLTDFLRQKNIKF